MSYGVEIAESAERDIADVTDVVAFAYGDPIGAWCIGSTNLRKKCMSSLSPIPDG